MQRRQRRWAACLLALASRAVAAPLPLDHPHVHVEVSLGAAQPGSDGLGYFVPEVALAFDEALRRGGLVVTAAGEPVTVELGEQPGDRVLLTAHVHGQLVELEGAAESLDALVDELATRVAPLCGASEPKHVSSKAEPAKVELPRLTKVEPAKVEPAKVEPAKVEPAKVEPAKPTPPVVAPPVVAPPVVAPPIVAPPIAKVEPARPEPRDPYGPDARVSDAPPLFERGRVVVHSLPDPPLDAPRGTGTVATDALYAVLQHRLRLSIVPMGVGITTSTTAAEEGLRAHARHVIMGRLDSFSYFEREDGPVARMRIELSVVSEGRVVLRRVLYAETPNGAVASGLAQGRSGRLVDPVYLAVTRALDGELGELQLALLGPPNAPR